MTGSAPWLRLALVGSLLLATGCVHSRPTLPGPERIDAPSPAEVERVLFLVGDAGLVKAETHPIVRRIQQDVEEWSRQLGRDSSVAVIMLGDNVYPLGLHPPGSDEYPHDSAVVMAQVSMVAGPAARAIHATQYFVAGNHDVGLKQDLEGFVRLRNFEDFLFAARAGTGANTYLVPVAGTGGPYVLDWGPSVRIIFLDTAWWLLQADNAERDRVLAAVDFAMLNAGERRVVFAAHHPMRTAGPHGGEFSFWRTLGMQYLLDRSGAILQDLRSSPYRRLERGLRDIFARYDPPLIFAGGHEHSLQVIEPDNPTDPLYTIVSGSAAKMTEVGLIDGLRYALSALGYVKILFERDGDAVLLMDAGPHNEELVCPAEGAEHEPCMQRGVASFRTVHSQRLR